MMKGNKSKPLFILVVVLILQMLIKGFDYSFHGVFDLSFRSIVFFFGFTIYWMGAWTLFTWLSGKLEKWINKRLNLLPLFLIHSTVIIILSGIAAVLFNFLYRSFDIRFFGMGAIWNQVPFPHSELIYPLILISLLIFTVDRFVGFADQLKNAELYAVHLEQVAIQSKYEALKNQVDPHFFFNSLSVLSSLVYSNPDLATKYIYNLSKLYRYTLDTKQSNFVSLTEELNSLESYLFLIQIRYPEEFSFKIGFDQTTADHIGIHQGTLQLLIENAIKHNTFKAEEPLSIEIYERDKWICVRNPLRIRKQITPSTGIGLDNIRKRYELYNHGKIVIDNSHGYFEVKLPKIKI